MGVTGPVGCPAARLASAGMLARGAARRLGSCLRPALHREERVHWVPTQRVGGRTPAVLPLAVSWALWKTACPALGHHPCCCCICPETSPHHSLSSCLLFSPALWGVPESLNPFHCSFFYLAYFSLWSTHPRSCWLSL